MKLNSRGRPRLQGLLNYYQRADKKFNLLDSYCFRILIWALKGLSNQIELDTERFIYANNLRFQSFDKNIAEDPNFKKTVDIAVVAAEKDFPLIKKCLFFASNSLDSYFSGKVYVIVPEASKQKCSQSLRELEELDIEIISEDEIIDSESRSLLRNRFGHRYGWVLQQLLKVAQVVRSPSSYTLIVDCDTLLLKKRRWIDQQGHLLFASWELNKPYYSFLSILGIGRDLPKYTFVTHHMLMQRELMNSALTHIGISRISQLIKILIDFKSESESPFCLEYELYAQYLESYKEDSFQLEKWSNLSVPREDVLDLSNEQLLNRYRNYASISAHSFLSAEA